MTYLVSAYLPEGARCELLSEPLSVAERYARHLIAAGSRRVDVFDADAPGTTPVRRHEEIRYDMVEAGELPPIADELWPLPGSPTAQLRGCTCMPQGEDDNPERYAIAKGCPLHGG